MRTSPTTQLLVTTALLLGACACTSYRTLQVERIAPEQRLRIRIAPPATLALLCEEAGDSVVTTPCGNGPTTESNIEEAWGTLRAAKGDSLLVRLTEVHSTAKGRIDLDPPRDAWISRANAVVQTAHFNAGGTVALVLLTVGVVVASIYAFSPPSFGGGAKPTSGGQ